MSDEHLRRTSNPSGNRPIPQPPPPPPPPPPRAQRSGWARLVPQQFSTYAAVASGTSRPSGHARQVDDDRRRTPFASYSGRPNAPQEASHKTGLEIAAFDINSDRTTAILAGREILKTVRIDNDRCSEETNLRAKLIQVASHRDALAAGRTGGSRNAPSSRDNLNIHDVKWSHGNYDSYIAGASTSGKVVLYDLNKHSLELARLHEHSRQVHKLAISPFQGYGLLSASQDGSVRFWDLRDLQRDQATVYGSASASALACASRHTYSSNQVDGVRDVKWSPVDAVQFAFGTDSGTVQCWDLRWPVRPMVKITAHDRTVTCVDWHPGGQYLASGSSDKFIRCWNIGPGPSQEDLHLESKNPNKRLKPSYSIRCPAPVSRIAWRTPAWSDVPISSSSGSFYADGNAPASAQTVNVWQTTHIAASYGLREARSVHVWDFRRPHIPFRELSPFPTSPTDLLWHSQHLLWLVGREGIFTQADVALALKCIDRRPWAAVDINPSGDAVATVTTRPRRRGAAHSIHIDLDARDRAIRERQPGSGSGIASSSSSAGTSNLNSASYPTISLPPPSRSAADDSVDDVFLSHSLSTRVLAPSSAITLAGAAHLRHHGRTHSARSAKSVPGTPPLEDIRFPGHGAGEPPAKVLLLEESMKGGDDQPRRRVQSGMKGMMPGIWGAGLQGGVKEAWAYSAVKWRLVRDVSFEGLVVGGWPDTDAVKALMKVLDHPRQKNTGNEANIIDPNVQLVAKDALERLLTEVAAPFERNAEYALKTANFRTAQTMRVVGALAATWVRDRLKAAAGAKLKRLKEQETKERTAAKSIMGGSTKSGSIRAGSIKAGSSDSPTTKSVAWGSPIPAKERKMLPPAINSRIVESSPLNPAKRAIYSPSTAQQSPTTPLRPPSSAGSAHGVESTSNVPTPVARPVPIKSQSQPAGLLTQSTLPDPDEEGDGAMKLPPSLIAYPPASRPGSHQARPAGTSQPFLGRSAVESSSPLTKSTGATPSVKPLDDVDPEPWYPSFDVSERRAQISNWRPQSKRLLELESPSLDPVNLSSSPGTGPRAQPTHSIAATRSPLVNTTVQSGGLSEPTPLVLEDNLRSTGVIDIRPGVERHNSGDSFAMFSEGSSVRSSKGFSTAGSFADHRGELDEIAEEPLHGSAQWSSGSIDGAMPPRGTGKRRVRVEADASERDESLQTGESWISTDPYNLSGESTEDSSPRMDRPPAQTTSALGAIASKPRGIEIGPGQKGVPVGAKPKPEVGIPETGEPSSSFREVEMSKTEVAAVQAVTRAQLMRKGSDDSDWYSSLGSKGSSFVRPQLDTVSSDHEVDPMEASGTIVAPSENGRGRTMQSQQTDSAGNLLGQSLSTDNGFDEREKEPVPPLDTTPRLATSQTTVHPLTLSDFTHPSAFAKPDDIDYERYLHPVNLPGLIPQLLEFYTASISDAQTATHILLLLVPLLALHPPVTDTVSTESVASILNALAQLSTPPGLLSSARKQLLSINAAGLNPIQAEAIITTYAAQLDALGHVVPAATIRNVCYPLFPAVWERAVRQQTMAIACGRCNKKKGVIASTLASHGGPPRSSRVPSISATATMAHDGGLSTLSILQPPLAADAVVDINCTRDSCGPVEEARICGICECRESPFGSHGGLGTRPHGKSRRRRGDSVQQSDADVARSGFASRELKGCPADIPATPEGVPVQDEDAGHEMGFVPLETVPHYTSLLSACPVCFHIAHDACRTALLTPTPSVPPTSSVYSFGFGIPSVTEGQCHVPGCICDCVAGPWRTERQRKQREREERSHERKGSVKRDDWRVGVSGAVREAVSGLGTRSGDERTAERGEGRVGRGRGNRDRGLRDRRGERERDRERDRERERERDAKRGLKVRFGAS